MKWWPSDDPGLAEQRITRTIGLNVKLGNIPDGRDSRGRAWSTRGCGSSVQVVTGKKYTAKAKAG